MDTVSVLESLIRLGTIVGDVASRRPPGKDVGLLDFFRQSAPAEAQDAVSGLISALTPDTLGRAVVAVERKQKDLLAGKSITELPTDKLIQFATLTDTKMLLNTARLKAAVQGDFVAWLVDGGGLATVIQVGKIALPLLV